MTSSICKNPSTDMTPTLSVFYDGQCPLCKKEIEHYQRLRGAARIAWIDIYHPQTDLSRYGLDRRTAMTRLHVLDNTGQWHTDAWAFAVMWANLPFYRALSWVLHKSRLLPLTDRFYNRFAVWRLRRRCTTSTCQSNNSD